MDAIKLTNSPVGNYHTAIELGPTIDAYKSPALTFTKCFSLP